jgi:hypothetical protein
MDWTGFMSECEDAAYGEFLIEAIATPLGIPMGKDTVNLISKWVYKGTDCGAWVKFDEQGIIVGSIVEGSDAEFSQRIDLSGIGMDDSGAEELNKRFWSALEEINQLAVDEWNECHF